MYKITNKVNSNIYIGVHGTENIDDGYFGSGKLLKQAILKYGIENFEKEIIQYFSSSEEMFLCEAEIVNEEFISRDDVYNIIEGGRGGTRALGKWIVENKLGWHSDKSRAEFKKFRESDIGRYYSNLGLMKMQSIESNHKRKATFKNIKHQSGTKNSQFSTKWITDGVNNKKIKNIDEVPVGWKLGRTINNDDQIGTHWITDGLNNKKIFHDEEIPSGWHRGRVIKK